MRIRIIRLPDKHIVCDVGGRGFGWTLTEAMEIRASLRVGYPIVCKSSLQQLYDLIKLHKGG